MKVTQSCLTFCDPTNYTVPGILQVRILEWVAFTFSRESSQSRDWTQVSCIAGGFFTSWATREAQEYWSGYPIPSPGGLCIAGRFFTNTYFQLDFQKVAQIILLLTVKWRPISFPLDFSRVLIIIIHCKVDTQLYLICFFLFLFLKRLKVLLCLFIICIPSLERYYAFSFLFQACPQRQSKEGGVGPGWGHRAWGWGAVKGQR